MIDFWQTGSLPTTFRLGPLIIYFYGVIFALAALVGYVVAIRLVPKRGLEIKKMEDLFLIGLPVSVIGARIYHVLDLWSYYQSHLLEILAVWQGGLGIYGGVMAGVLFVLVYSRRQQLPILKILDVLVPALALGQAIGRWGNFVNQEAFGPPTNLPWGIPIEPRYRPLIWSDQNRFHPFFLYESLLDLVNFGLLLIVFRKTGKPGLVAGLYFINYGLIRFFLEFFRWDTAVIGSVKTAHILSVISIIFGLGLLAKSGCLSTPKKSSRQGRALR